MDWMAAVGWVEVDAVVEIVDVICYDYLKSRFNTLLHMYMLYNQFFKQYPVLSTYTWVYKIYILIFLRASYGV